MAMVTAEISHSGAESPAVFVLRAGPEARRSLSTTPDDCPSPRHAIRRRTLGGARLAAVRWNRARGSTPYPYPDGFWHRPRSQARRAKLNLADISVSDARPMLDRYWRSERCGRSPVAPKAGSAALCRPGKCGGSLRMRTSAVNLPLARWKRAGDWLRDGVFPGQQM